MTTRKRRTFKPRLKLEVVRLINEQGQSVQNVSEAWASARLLSGAGCSSMVLSRMASPASANRSPPSSKESASWSWKISNFGRTLPS